MNRTEIEIKLHESRVWLLEILSSLSEATLHQPVTPSEHDPTNYWTPLDHVAHLALIEDNFAQMVRRHVSGNANSVGLLTNEKGEPQSREQIMIRLHAMTDEFQQKHHGDSLSEVIALTASARSRTLQLVSELSDDQLGEKLPGAPWADGTIGGVLAVNADHASMHWKWVTNTNLVS